MSTPAQREPHRPPPPRVPVIARARCELAGGEIRHLYATEITRRGAKILAMRPPALGEIVHVTLTARRLNALPPIRCRVISARLDPSDPHSSGFEVMFTALDDTTRGRLRTTLRFLGVEPAERATIPVTEKRVHPRVLSDLKGAIAAGGSQWSVRVVNLSLGGARLLFAEAGAPPGLSAGSRFEISIVCDEIPEMLTLRAEVAWVGGGLPSPMSAGVRFLDVDATAGARLEGLLLRLVGDLAEDLGLDDSQ